MSRDFTCVLQTMPLALIRLFAFVAIVFGATAQGPSVVYAHNTQETSSPAGGEVFDAPPAEWTVGFEKTVPLASATAEVVNGSGVRIALAPPRHGVTDNIIVFALPPELLGSVTARWRLVGVDGHVISGRIGFSVNGAAAATTTPADVAPVAPPVEVAVQTFDEPIAQPIRFVNTLLNYLSLMLFAGVFMTEWFVAQGTLALSLSRRFALVGAIGIAVTSLLQLLIFVDDIGTDGRSWLAEFGDTLETTPGAMLFAKAIVGLIFVAFARGLVKGDAITGLRSQLLAASGLMYLVALSYVGHSRSEGAPWLGIPVDVAHTAGSTVWLGGLVSMVFIVIPQVDIERAVSAFDRFGYIAERAVAVLVVTGVIQTIRLHTNPLLMLMNTHGLLLILKILLVALMLWLAAKNRRSLLGRKNVDTAQPKTLRRLLIRASLIETAIGGVVLAVTAALVASTPT